MVKIMPDMQDEINKLKQRVFDLERNHQSTEVSLAVRAERDKAVDRQFDDIARQVSERFAHADKRFDKIDFYAKWIVTLALGGFASAVINFIVKGGLSSL